MNIRIKRLSLQNFKCFREKDITFNDEVTTVRGRNGVGKTTIADAILWCLFGKNNEGKDKFNLKTYDENGVIIPHLDHSVELVLSVRTLIHEGKDENTSAVKEVTLKRILKETWVKKRGADEQVFKDNTTEYMVNGEVKTATDYKKFISDLISESTFRIITNPYYFPSLKWQEQRAFLEQLCGDAEVTFTDENLLNLHKELEQNNDDIVSYRKHLSYQIREIKKKLDDIPVKLETANKALPEKLDWDSLQQMYDAKAQHCKEVDSQITTIKAGNGSDIKRAELRLELQKVRQQIDKITDEGRIKYSEEQRLHNNLVAEKQRKFFALSRDIEDAKTLAASCDVKKKHLQATIGDCDKDLQALREQWPSGRFMVDPELRTCPTCGQLLPTELYEQKILDMEQKFNLDKEAKKKELNKKAANIKKTKEDAEAEIKAQEQKKEETENLIKTLTAQMNEAFAEKQKLEKELMPDFETFCHERNVDYLPLCDKQNELAEQIANITDSADDKEKLTELMADKSLSEAELSNLQQQLASRTQYEKVSAIIDQINIEQKDLVRQLSALERSEDIARQYEDNRNSIMEQAVNRHFQIVKWRMFRTVNNGGEPFNEPYCECYVDGVAYHDGLNDAARLNAGLDIINALCKFYNVSAPIVIDKAESTLTILPTVGQQVRLQVFNSDFSLV